MKRGFEGFFTPAHYFGLIQCFQIALMPPNTLKLPSGNFKIFITRPEQVSF